MADQEALRELQNRLATQLQAARTQDRGRAWLAVEVGRAGLLLPLSDAGEIFPYRGAVAVPHTRPWFLGVANLRGVLHGVVDLAGFLGLDGPSPARPVGAADGWLVALNPRLESNGALRVDRLAGLRREDQLQRVDPANTADTPARPPFAGAVWLEEVAASATAPARRRWWQEILLDPLAAQGHFLDIAATL